MSVSPLPGAQGQAERSCLHPGSVPSAPAGGLPHLGLVRENWFQLSKPQEGDSDSLLVGKDALWKCDPAGAWGSRPHRATLKCVPADTPLCYDVSERPGETQGREEESPCTNANQTEVNIQSSSRTHMTFDMKFLLIIRRES